MLMASVSYSGTSRQSSAWDYREELGKWGSHIQEFRGDSECGSHSEWVVKDPHGLEAAGGGRDCGSGVLAVNHSKTWAAASGSNIQ